MGCFRAAQRRQECTRAMGSASCNIRPSEYSLSAKPSADERNGAQNEPGGSRLRYQIALEECQCLLPCRGSDEVTDTAPGEVICCRVDASTESRERGLVGRVEVRGELESHVSHWA